MNNVNEIFSNSENIKAFGSHYFKHLSNVLQKINLDQIQQFVESLLQAREQSSNIYFIGNGGSAATASHFANDLGVGTRTWEKPFRVMSLVDNQAIITALGNDYSYEDIFVKQLEILLRKNDVLVSISASGNSRNLIKATDYANKLGATTIGLTAFDGGILKNIVDINVQVPTEKGDYGPAEDAHMILDHLVSNYLSRYCLQLENKKIAVEA